MQSLTSDMVRNSFGDGIFATMFASLTSGVFLTGFALHLGMDVTAIGLLAAIPYAATLFQLPVSVAIARRGNQKPIALGNAFAGRLLWLLILAAGLLPIISPARRIAALADLVAMRLWGVVSDRIRNRTVIRTCSAVAVFLPLVWTFVRPGDRLFPIGLHIVGSFFWVGITLCTNNMVLRMAPRTDRAVCISLHNIAAGLGAALAPVVAGIAAERLGGDTVSVLTRQATPLQVIFLASTGMRLASLQLLRWVREPDGVPDQRVVRVLRNVRGLNTASGFNGVLHPFVSAPGSTRPRRPAGPDHPANASATLADDRSTASACSDGRQPDAHKQELSQ
jgi:F0F1-type ATP synthase membrane subunit c/vacuolar-type H+-ATPase subunit K